MLVPSGASTRHTCGSQSRPRKAGLAGGQSMKESLKLTRALHVVQNVPKLLFSKAQPISVHSSLLSPLSKTTMQDTTFFHLLSSQNTTQKDVQSRAAPSGAELSSIAVGE